MIRPEAPAAGASRLHVAQLVYDHVHRSFDLLESIISDRDLASMSMFWQALMDKMGVRLRPSSAYHPQTDGRDHEQEDRSNAALLCQP